MSETIDTARAQVADTAAAIARRALEPDVDLDAIGKRASAVETCAKAVQAVAFGPQGGTADHHTEQTYRYPGERLPAGFQFPGDQ